MSDSNSIINLGELAKPATVLVEKISDAVGGIARPWQIKRVAQAEAEADRIRAVTQIEVTELQRRAMRRMLMEEAKKQNNIEAITAKALPHLSEEAKPENIEDDWLTNFFDKGRLISDEQMQRLWAEILAGEANAPGKFSKRTINLLAGLDKIDAQSFSSVCRFSVSLNERTPLIYDWNHKIYTNQGVNFAMLSHLDSIGLIHFQNSMGSYNIGVESPKGYVRYFDQALWIEFPTPEYCRLDVGRVLLTLPGRQLAQFAEVQPVDGFAQYVREQWKQHGYKTEPDPLPIPPVAGN